MPDLAGLNRIDADNTRYQGSTRGDGVRQTQCAAQTGSHRRHADLVQVASKPCAVSQDFDLVRAFWSGPIAAASPWSRQIEVAHSPQPKFLCSRVAVVPVPIGPLSDILPVHAPPSR